MKGQKVMQKMRGISLGRFSLWEIEWIFGWIDSKAKDNDNDTENKDEAEG